MSALSEIVGHVAAAGHGTLATDLFQGFLPEEQTACVSIAPSAGAPDVRSFGGVEYEVRRYQVFVRAASYAAAETKAEAVYLTLRDLANRTLPATTPTAFYLSIETLSAPYLLDRDRNGAVTLSFNIETLRHGL